MAILAALIGCQAEDAYQELLAEALDRGVSQIEVKEIVYQATDYVGYGKMLPFLLKTNELLSERGVPLPLEGQETTTLDDRLEKGVQIQVAKSGHFDPSASFLSLDRRAVRPLAVPG